MNMEEAKEKKEISEREDMEGPISVVEGPISVEPEGSKRIQQPWTKQITIRGMVVSIMIGTMYSVIAMKLNLTTGLVPNLNVSAALIAFVFIRTWTKMLTKAGFVSKPFTKQENTMIQTCAVACYSIAVGGEAFNIFAY
jgi:uncharacterized oligopeptide transporter (OPT) family protein